MFALVVLALALVLLVSVVRLPILTLDVQDPRDLFLVPAEMSAALVFSVCEVDLDVP